ncbi:MAG: radical SAM protein [Ruminococcus sp.]|jgi:7-carboxy-7-deazaguanine synthase|nr:radical SAM protein [Ruminococcus sp.]
MKVVPVRGKIPDKNDRTAVAEMFSGINGEGLKQGAPATFIRFAGCNLSCEWCDTKWANDDDCPALYLTPDEIYFYALDKGLSNVTLTGGEPLLALHFSEILRKFADDPFFSSEIETNGSIPLDYIRRSGEKISFTVDCKLPSSGMSDRIVYKNFGLLGKRDCVKFVVGSADDLEQTAAIIKDYSLAKRTNIFLSPVYGVMNPEEIADFIVNNALDARLGLQLHKIIWGDRRRK